MQGFRSVLKEKGVNARISIEQMDVIGKRRPFDNDYFANHIKWRFGDQKFDLVVANDDPAFRFVALKYRELFEGIPVVFADVNNIGAIPIPPDMPYTGVAEQNDFLSTLEIAQKLRPNARTIAVFGNSADSGAGPRKALTFLQELKGDLPFEFHLDKTVEEIEAISSKLTREDIVIGIAYASDENGVFRDYNEVRGAIGKASPAASFVFWKTADDDRFAIGGKVSSANEQGKAAALIATRVLAGEDIRSIPIMAAPTKYVFNHPIMTRMGISEDDLPQGSEFIQKPYSIYETFKAELWSIAALIVGLCGIIFILVTTIARRKKAETALVKSEERFRDFASTGADWFWETDSELRFTYISENYVVVFGFLPDVNAGKSGQQVYSSDNEIDTIEWRNHLLQLEQHQAFSDFEIDRRKPGGSGRYISVSGKPIFDEDENFQGYRGVGRDITLRKEIGEALEAALVDAERANGAKSEFLATMSHEFRTPLNAILGFSEMLRSQYFGPLGSENYKEYADDIHNSGEHMLGLVNDVLDVAALEAGKRSFSKEYIDVPDLLNSCIRKVSHALNNLEKELSCQVPDDLPQLYSDRRSVVQVLINLLSNAIKFTKNNGIISVSANVSNQHMVFIIQDSGIGIAADRLQKITEPFSQSQADPYMAEEGTGLGLSIVKSLVTALDGDLKIESKINAGTTVTVKLPYLNNDQKRF